MVLLETPALLGRRLIGKEELGRGNLGARERPISEHALQRVRMHGPIS